MLPCAGRLVTILFVVPNQMHAVYVSTFALCSAVECSMVIASLQGLDAHAQVWEVAAQLLGLGGSIVALRAIEASGDPRNVLWAWASCQVLLPHKTVIQ